MKFSNTLPAIGGISAKTMIKEGENVLDTLNNLSGKVNSNLLNTLGQEKLAKAELDNKRSFVERNLTEELSNKTNLNNIIESAENSGSFVTRENAGGKIVQGVSQMVPRAFLTKYLGIPTLAGSSIKGLSGLEKAIQIGKNVGKATLVNLPANSMIASSVYGSSLEEAYQNGATEEEATKYAIGNTATEIATEWITGGIPGTNGVGGLDILANKGIDKISNQFVKELAKYGYKMVGEGSEESLAEIINPLLKNATYSEGEKIDWKAVVESAIYGGLTSGILELPGTISNLRLNSANRNSSRLNNQNIQEINSENNINNFDVFTKQVDKVIKGTWDTNNHLTVLEHTPQVLQQLGVKDYPILLLQIN